MTIKKKRMGSGLISLGSLLLLLAVSTSIYAVNNNTTSQQTTPAANAGIKPTGTNKLLQFVVSAHSGNLQLLDAKQELYQLTLNNAANQVLYFTNRPRRIVQTMATGFFLKRWVKPPPHDFISVPPNVALSYPSKDDIQQTILILMLMNPVYDEKTGSLVFQAKSAAGSKLPEKVSFQQPILMFAEPTVCGVLGAWGNLPGEKQFDAGCHKGEE